MHRTVRALHHLLHWLACAVVSSVERCEARVSSAHALTITVVTCIAITPRPPRDPRCRTQRRVEQVFRQQQTARRTHTCVFRATWGHTRDVFTRRPS
eukprot:4675240-Prymnesium_polylepis.1